MARSHQKKPTDPIVELVEPDRLSVLLAELGDDDDGVTVSLYEVDPKNRNLKSFLFTLPSVDDVTGPVLMTNVLEKYGAGEYVAEGRDAEGKIVFGPRFRVGSSRRALDVIPGPAQSSATPATSELAAILAGQTKILEAILARVAAPVDPLAQLRQYKELRELFAPSSAPAPAFDLAGVVNAVKGVLDLRETLGSAGGEPEGPLGTFAKYFGPAVTRLIESSVPQPGQPALPNPTPRPQLNGEHAQQVDAMQNATMLRVYVAELVRMAESKTAADVAADRIVATLNGFPESVRAGVVEWLNDEDVITKLAELDPRAAQHAGWLDAVIDGVLDAFGLTDGDPEPAPPAKPDNTQTAPG